MYLSQKLGTNQLKCNFVQRKFAVTSVLKLNTKVWELSVHPGYDHLYIIRRSLPLTSK